MQRDYIVCLPILFVYFNIMCIASSFTDTVVDLGMGEGVQLLQPPLPSSPQIILSSSTQMQPAIVVADVIR